MVRYRKKQFTVLALLASAWLVASTFLVRMPLRIQWFTRMTAVMLLIAAIYSTVQVFLIGDLSSLVAGIMFALGVWVVVVGYLFQWPNTTVWASNLVGGFGVLVGSGYLLYRNVEGDAIEGESVPA